MAYDGVYETWYFSDYDGKASARLSWTDPEPRFTADFDGDGKADHVWISGYYGSTRWVFRDGLYDSVNPTAPISLTVSPFAVPLDGTARSRLLVANGSHYALTDLDAPTTLLATPLPTATDHFISFADLNADGSADAFVRSRTGSRLGDPDTIFISTGDGGFRRIHTDGESPGDEFGWTADDGAIEVPTGLVRLDYFQDGHPAWFAGRRYIPNEPHSPLLRAGNLNGPPRWQEAPDLPSSFWGGIGRVGDIDGDGLDDLVLPYDNALQVFFRNGKRADLLTKVRTGYGDETRVSYGSPEAAPYAGLGAPCVYPLRCGVHGLTTVESVTFHASDATAKREFDYYFKDAAVNAQTGAFVGFGQMTTVDVATQATTFTYYGERNVVKEDPEGRMTFFTAHAPTSIEQDFPYNATREVRVVTTIGYQVAASDATASSFVTRPTSTSVVRTERPRFGNPGPVIVLESRNSTTVYETPGIDVPAYGNVKSTTTTYPDLAITETSTFTWEPPGTSNWLIARPKRETHTSTIGGATPMTRTREFATSPDTGLVTDLTVEPDSTDPDIWLKTTIVRDYGEPRSIVETDRSGKSRRIDIEYDTIDATFPVRMIDPLGHATTFVYHPGVGVLAESTDANGVKVRQQYDGFGRPKKQFAPQCPAGLAPSVFNAYCGGATTTFAYVEPSSAQAVFALKVTQPGSPGHTNEYDALGRLVWSRQTAFDGTNEQFTSVLYDPIFTGQPALVSTDVAPGVPGAPETVRSRNTHYTYDLLGRPTEIKRSDLSTTALVYDGLRVTVTDPESAVSYTEYDQLGRPVTSAAVLGTAGTAISTRQYGPFGDLSRITDPMGNKVEYIYDLRGRTLSRTDQDSGKTQYGWTAFGEARSQTDAKLRVTTFGYDDLGRVLGSKSVDGTSCYQYDGGEYAIGRRTFASRRDVRTDGSTDTVVTSTEYDPLGRPLTTHQTVNSGPDLSITFGHDQYGRPSAVELPAIDGKRLKLTNKFDLTTGYFNGVVGQFGTDAEVPYWTRQSENLAGELTSERFGDDVNGVVTTYTRDADTGRVTNAVAQHGSTVVQSAAYQWWRDGNLRRIDDASVRDLHGAVVWHVEQYQYDAAKRLTNWNGPWGSVAYGYDLGNNLISRVISPATGTSQTQTFTPGPQGAARSAGSPPAHAVVSGPTAGESYGYNEVGDQTAAPGSRTVDWTTFHLPRQISQGGHIVRFVYGPDGERVQKVDDFASETTTYAGGGVYELRERDSDATHVYAISAAGRQIAQMEVLTKEGAVQSKQTHYLHTNHLGTVHAISDESGSRVDLITHEPFGQRVMNDAPTQPYTGTGSVDEDVRVGFTGQEEDRSVGLVNLNGRLYDPTTARFTSPDTVIGGSAGLNQYAYVGNNPVNHTDPTGHCFDTIFGCINDDGRYATPVWIEQTFGGGGGGGGGEGATPIDPSPPRQYAPPPPPRQHAANPVPYAPLNGGVAAVAPFSTGGFAGFSPARPQRLGGGTFEPVPAGVGEAYHWWDSVDRFFRVHGETTAVVVGTASVAVGTAGMGVYAVGMAGAAGTLGTGGAAWGAAAGLPVVAVPALGAGTGASLVAPVAAAAAPAAAKAAEAAPALYDDLDTLAQFAPAVPRASGGFVNVVTHADKFVAWVQRGGQWVAISHRTFARFVTGLPQYSGQPVRLVACEAGACSNGFAQNLANSLGVAVEAATDKVFVDENGAFWTTGAWRVFTPGQ